MAILYKKKNKPLSKAYIKSARKKAGGSNVGKYKGVKSFAGPSGGSPKGSYPINTRERGKSALKLAHNAPNPTGVKAAVYRKYPGLKDKKKCKGGILKYQTGNKSPYVYESAIIQSENPRYKKIRTKTSTGTTRCFGSGIDAVCTKINPEHGFDYRSVFAKTYGTADRVPGDSDNVVDAWDAKNAAYNTDDITVSYDRDITGDITNEHLSNLALNSIILTGDARKGETGGRRSFVSGKDKNPNRISRHAITVTGFTKDGVPIIYDLGKFHEGIPDKYKGEINAILSPTKDRKYFDQNYLTASTTSGKAKKVNPEAPKEEKPTIKKKPSVKLQTSKLDTSYTSRFLKLIKDTFNVG